LSTYDNLIENNTKRIKLLEQMAENLYKEWFVRFRFPGHENTPMENGLPKGWKISRLEDFGRIETGKTPSMEKSEYYNGEYLFVKTPDMHGSVFVLNTSETLSEAGNNCQKKKLLPINSIMVSCIGTGGVVAINAKPAHTNQQINSIILYNQNYLEWLYYTCKSLKSTIELFGATGATMTNLSKGKLKN
ncbi:MAG: restriction endonuclease subunit S, partial [bacterium]|nr:restriction endonuclease subunit S [Candidatus Minthenecus merdequi]